MLTDSAGQRIYSFQITRAPLSAATFRKATSTAWGWTWTPFQSSRMRWVELHSCSLVIHRLSIAHHMRVVAVAAGDRGSTLHGFPSRLSKTVRICDVWCLVNRGWRFVSSFPRKAMQSFTPPPRCLFILFHRSFLNLTYTKLSEIHQQSSRQPKHLKAFWLSSRYNLCSCWNSFQAFFDFSEPPIQRCEWRRPTTKRVEWRCEPTESMLCFLTDSILYFLWFWSNSFRLT